MTAKEGNMENWQLHERETLSRFIESEEAKRSQYITDFYRDRNRGGWAYPRIGTGESRIVDTTNPKP